MDCRVTFQELWATAVLRGFGMDCVGVVVVGDHDVSESASGCDWESAGLISVIFS